MGLYRRGCLRPLFFGVAILLWCIVLGLLLELAAQVLQKREWRHNTYVALELGVAPVEPPPPRKNAIRLPGPDDKSPLPPPASSAGNSIRKKAQTHSPGPTENSWRAGFPALSSRERDMQARMHRNLVLLMNSDGEVQASYGSYASRAYLEVILARVPAMLLPRLLGTMPRVAASAVREACGTQRPVQADFKLFDSEPYPYLLEARPHPGRPERAFVFFFFDYVALRRHIMPTPPADSVWEVQWLKFKPNVQDAMRDFSTNNFGFRDDPVALPKPADVYRILCLGGSTTEEGPTNAETYPNILERLLDARFSKVRIEVVNCGIPGITSDGQVARMPDYLKLDPDLVVLYMGVNDAIDLCVLMPDLFTGLLRQGWAYSAAVRRWVQPTLAPEPPEIDPGIAHFTIRNTEVLAQTARAQGARIALATIACPNRAILCDEEATYLDYRARTAWNQPGMSFQWYAETIDKLNEAYEALCASRGYYLVPLAQHIRGGLGVFNDICHMGQRGIRGKAHIMAHYLVPLIADCLATRDGTDRGLP
ncbi:MAG: SGNH/GDSL hydrolase family protein [Candidatus Hydrogenedentota bacterium]